MAVFEKYVSIIIQEKAALLWIQIFQIVLLWFLSMFHSIVFTSFYICSCTWMCCWYVKPSTYYWRSIMEGYTLWNVTHLRVSFLCVWTDGHTISNEQFLSLLLNCGPIPMSTLTGFRGCPTVKCFMALSQTFLSPYAHFPKVCISSDFAWGNYPQFIALWH